MGILGTVTKSSRNRPPRLLLYGIEGIGKSTFASQMPSPVFLPTEDGIDGLEVDSFPLATSLGDVNRYLEGLLREKHEFATLVVDSLSALERLIWQSVCEESGVDSIEKACGAYGKGYVRAAQRMGEFLASLDYLRDAGMSVCLISHASVGKVDDPEHGSYTAYAPRLNEKARNLVCEWADVVGFATRKMRVNAEDAGFGRTKKQAKGLGKETGGDRILKLVGSPALVAKNRYGMPAEIPLSWSDFAEAMTSK